RRETEQRLSSVPRVHRIDGNPRVRERHLEQRLVADEQDVLSVRQSVRFAMEKLPHDDGVIVLLRLTLRIVESAVRFLARRAKDGVLLVWEAGYEVPLVPDALRRYPVQVLPAVLVREIPDDIENVDVPDLDIPFVLELVGL